MFWRDYPDIMSSFEVFKVDLSELQYLFDSFCLRSQTTSAENDMQIKRPKTLRYDFYFKIKFCF